MSNYKEAILPIVKEANTTVFKSAQVASLFGIVILGLSVWLLEVGSLRTAGVVIGLLFMGLPFLLRFFIDKHKEIGLIRLTEGEILTKMKGSEPVVYPIDETSSRMNVRTGAENQITWISKGKLIAVEFKLENELQKRKSIYFLEELKRRTNTDV